MGKAELCVLYDQAATTPRLFVSPAGRQQLPAGLAEWKRWVGLEQNAGSNRLARVLSSSSLTSHRVLCVQAFSEDGNV